MTTQVKLFLLGPFRAESAGQPLTAFKSNKVRALLAYLAVEQDTPQHRDVLAALLWPESANALALLRDVLSNLRSVLGDRDTETPIIQTPGDTLQLDRTALWLDVAAFSDLAINASSEETLAQAAALYRGDFLEGFSLASSPEFEVWSLLHREILRDRMQEVLYRLTTSYLQHSDYAAARNCAQRQLGLDGYSEEAHRQLLRALALDGQRNQALAHYAEYRKLLDEELSVAPDVRTTALYQRIRAGGLRPNVASKVPPPDPLLPSANGKSHSSFVGRAAELRRLETALQQTQQGAGQVVLVTGEAGSGKTMLAQTFAHRVLTRADDVVVARGACNAQIGTGDPYLPFREILRLLTGDFDVPATGGVLTLAYEQQLETFMPTVVQALREKGADLIERLVPANPVIAGVVEAGRADSELTASRRTSSSPREFLSASTLCDQVTRVLRTVARQCVLVLVLDDLQWADSGTLNLLAHLGRRLAGSRILIIGIYRPAEIGPDHLLSSTVQELRRMHGDIVLDLDQAGGADFVDAFLDSTPNVFEATFRAQLTRQTRGHALFTAALIQQMRDDGTLVRDADGRWRVGADLDWSQLPPRVEAVITKRLARLPERFRDLLSIASVEGETFTAEVVARVLDQPLEGVERELRALGGDGLSGTKHNLIYGMGLERVADRRVARYQFRHALFQQYLYTRLGSVQRARYHEAIGQALERLHAGHLDAVAAQLAYHFEAAGLFEQAVAYLLRAGQQAYRLSAPAESATLYQRGLTLLEQLPPSIQRDRRELDLLLNQESTLMAIRGWGSPERARSLQRAYQLGHKLGETTRLLPVLQVLASVHIGQAEHHIALDYAEQLIKLAEKTSNGLGLVMGKRMAGTVHFFLGHYEQARTYLETGLREYAVLSPEIKASKQILTAEEGLRVRVWLPHVLLVLGYPVQAAAFSREALACPQALDYVGMQAVALTIDGAAFNAIAKHPRATLNYAEQLLALVTEHPLPSYRGWATFYYGWARSQQGELNEGLAEMRSGLAQLEATGTQGTLLHLLTLLAEIYIQCGEIQRGADALSRALHHAARTGERSYLAETHRVQGALHLKKQAVDAAEASFTRAIEIAQDQEAKLWELRAVVELARLWETQGRAEEAHAKLSKLYAWFTEGLDTPDLQEAAVLLGGGAAREEC